MENKQPDAFKLIGVIFAAVGGFLAVVAGALCCFFLRTRTMDAHIGFAVTGTLALVFLGVGCGFLYAVRRKRLLRESLLAGGCRVRAKVAGVTRNAAVQVNGRCPYRVICRYTDGGAVHEFHSEDLWTDPTTLLLSDEVDVYLDRGNMDRYYVDLPSILPQIVVH